MADIRTRSASLSKPLYNRFEKGRLIREGILPFWVGLIARDRTSQSGLLLTQRSR